MDLEPLVRKSSGSWVPGVCLPGLTFSVSQSFKQGGSSDHLSVPLSLRPHGCTRDAVTPAWRQFP